MTRKLKQCGSPGELSCPSAGPPRHGQTENDKASVVQFAPRWGDAVRFLHRGQAKQMQMAKHALEILGQGIMISCLWPGRQRWSTSRYARALTMRGRFTGSSPGWCTEGGMDPWANRPRGSRLCTILQNLWIRCPPGFTWSVYGGRVTVTWARMSMSALNLPVAGGGVQRFFFPILVF
jgi:hypothetical protein